MAERPVTRRRRLDDLDHDAIQRPRISEESRSEFESARESDDLQAQIDIIWSILTGGSE